MMKYKKYKNSEFEWLQEIPEHWNTDRLKNIFSFGTGLSITKKNLLDNGIPCVNYGEIHSKYGFEVNPKIHSLKCVSPEYLSTSKKSLLRNGDFVFADTSEDIEGSGNFTFLNSNDKVFAGYHTIAAKPKRKLNSRYVAFLFDSITFRNQFRSNVFGIKVFSITQGLLNRLNIFFPPLSEQTAIAQYLDAKTQAIDKKINLLTKKAETYKELRKSIINDAVCKGLDKNVKLKESGIDWIGNVPTHWEIIRIKDVFNQISKIGSEIGVNNYIPLENIESQTGKLIQRISNENNEVTNLFKKGDILVNKLRPYLAKVYLPEFDGGVSGEVIVFRVSNVNQKKISSKYYFYRFLSSQFIEKINSITDGVKMPRTNPTKINCLEIAIPPLSEQTAIANYLDEKTQKIDAIVSNIGKQIDTLKELRKTLINDVVTGKIKVSEPLIDID